MSQLETQQPTANQSQISPDRHGMVLIGEKTIYGCHLPMLFVPEHKFQVILRYRLPDFVQDHLVRDQRKYPHLSYILINPPGEEFRLEDIITGTLAGYTGDIYRVQNFSQLMNASPWYRGVTVSVEWVEFDAALPSHHTLPQNANYWLFGDHTEAHITHLIWRDPSFQHVATLREWPSWMGQRKFSLIRFEDVPEQPSGGGSHQQPPVAPGEHRIRYQKIHYDYIVVDRTRWFDVEHLHMKHGKVYADKKNKKKGGIPDEEFDRPLRPVPSQAARELVEGELRDAEFDVRIRSDIE